MQYQEMLQMRKQRGYEIAKSENLIEKNGIWFVPSQSNPTKTYHVVLSIDKSTCTCHDFVERGIKCKHIFSVEITLSKKLNKNGTITVTTIKKETYPLHLASFMRHAIPLLPVHFSVIFIQIFWRAPHFTSSNKSPDIGCQSLYGTYEFP